MSNHIGDINKMVSDGGPAFPLNDPLKSTGMTLRDYFAAAALQAMDLTIQHTSLEYAQDAYAFADAMLKAREGVK